MLEGVDGLLREKTRPPGIPRTPDEKRAEARRRIRRHTGRSGQWRRPSGSRPRRCGTSGRRMASRHIAGASSSVRTPPPHQTHDDALFAALDVLDVLDGAMIGQNMARHRHQEVLRFLDRIERNRPAGNVIHVILDNDAAHKHARFVPGSRR